MRFGALGLGLFLIQAQPAHAACDVVPSSFIARADVYAISAAQMLVEAGCAVALEVLRRDWEEFQRPSPRRWNPWDANREHFAKKGAVAGSILGTPGVEIDRGDGVQFSVAADGRTVIEILNDIVTQSAPRGWWVIRSNDVSPRVESVGFIHRFGSMTSRAVQLP